MVGKNAEGFQKENIAEHGLSSHWVMMKMWYACDKEGKREAAKNSMF